MKWYIKQQVFSWNDKFDITDESGRPIYHVEGEIFSWNKKLHVYDMDGNEVIYIEQELWHWLPHYNIFVRNQQQAQVVREFSWFWPHYRIDGPAWDVEGAFWAHEYQVMQGEQPIASIHKEWMTWGDTYQLEVGDTKNGELALGIVLVIDCVMASS